MMSKVVVLEDVAWRSRSLGTFGAMAAEIEGRFGAPSVRDLDSNGLGPFDAHLLRFGCGLEVVLWRFQLGPYFEAFDPAVEKSCYEAFSPEPRDLDHVAFHLGVAVERMSLARDVDGELVDARVAPGFKVMRTDDNGNDVEMARVTSRCEAEEMVAQYERRGHKQLYWISE